MLNFLSAVAVLTIIASLYTAVMFVLENMEDDKEMIIFDCTGDYCRLFRGHNCIFMGSIKDAISYTAHYGYDKFYSTWKVLIPRD